MTGKGVDLALRFRKALDRTAAEQDRIERQRLRRAVEGRRARTELFADLEAFGRAVGHLDVERGPERLTMGWGEQRLVFEAVGDGDEVGVRLEGSEDAEPTPHRLYREPRLGDRWVLSLWRRGREERLTLFDSGLEALLVIALELPGPED